MVASLINRNEYGCTLRLRCFRPHAYMPLFTQKVTMHDFGNVTATLTIVHIRFGPVRDHNVYLSSVFREYY